MSEAELNEPAPRCMNLACKSMMIYGEDFESDPEYEDGMVDFWCQCTGTSAGPDNLGVSMEECCDAERECYQEY